jgi:hypothetical protein
MIMKRVDFSLMNASGLKKRGTMPHYSWKGMRGCALSFLSSSDVEDNDGAPPGST